MPLPFDRVEDLAGYTEEQVLKMQKRVAELFGAGSFQGDIARLPFWDLVETDVFVLEAVQETALLFGHAFE